MLHGGIDRMMRTEEVVGNDKARGMTVKPQLSSLSQATAERKW